MEEFDFGARRYREVDWMALPQALLDECNGFFGVSVEKGEVADAVTSEEGARHRAVESAMVGKLASARLPSGWHYRITDFHMSPSELKTPVPRTERMLNRNLGPCA